MGKLYKEPLTVIIPARNASSTIERAVISAVECQADNVLIYDDASTDKTLDKLERLWEKHPEVKYYAAILDIRNGCSFARNFLTSKAPMGLIVPLDADDELTDLKSLVGAYDDGLWVYGDYNEVATQQFIGKEYTPRQSPPEGMIRQKPLCYATMLFHKRDWQKVAGYDIDFSYAEDYGFQCALTYGGIRPKHVKTIVYNRYLSANDRTEKATTYWKFYHTMAREKYHFA